MSEVNNELFHHDYQWLLHFYEQGDEVVRKMIADGFSELMEKVADHQTAEADKEPTK